MSLPASVTPRPVHLRLMPPDGSVDGQLSLDALLEDAQAAERQGRRDIARELYEHALHSLREPEQAPVAASLLRRIAFSYQMDANLDAALDCTEAALAISVLANDVAGIGHALNHQAIVRFREGELDEAERLYREARSRAISCGDSKLSAMTAQNLGVLANIRGDLDEALRHYEASLADYRLLALPKDVCVALNNLGMLYTQMQRWVEATAAYEEALQIATVLGDMSSRIMLEVNLANLWVARQDLDQAHAACQRALELSGSLGDSHALGEAHKVLGVVARERSEFAEAERHFLNAESHAAERQNHLLVAESLRERAELHRRQGRNKDTLVSLNKAHRLFTQLRARRELADVDRRTSRLEGEFIEVVQKWGESIESKDRYTLGHCQRVADLACSLATRAGLDANSLFWFRIGALLHDVGKILVPTEVLNKPGKLTPEEWDLIRRHPSAGVEMLADIDFPWDVRPMVESHHERWDGKGYPHNLKGEDIPFTARILCIADVYDALTSIRSYKQQLSHAEAMDIMRKDSGTAFDPELFELFEEVMKQQSPAARLTGSQPVITPSEPLPAPRVADTPPDELTGLPLRRAFVTAAARVLAQGTSQQLPPALLVIDVDHFKLVNDTYGHLQGDDVLRLIADTLRDSVRNVDFVGRYAGDEFVVLLPRTLLEEAREVAERIRAAVASRRIALRERDGFLTVSLSIGVAVAPSHGCGLDTLFAAADGALYEAKRQGRNGVAVAGAAGVQATPRLNFERFVGRTAELRRLVRLLDESTREGPRVAVLSGEAGVGKTTLLRQLAPEIRLRGGTLVVGRCHEADVKAPYGPWTEIIESIRAAGTMPAREWRELPRLVPALGEIPAENGSQAGTKYALLDEIAEYIRESASATPLVILLDDMQWADSASWDALEHLLSRIDSDRIMVCLTIRAEDALGEVVRRRRRLTRDERVHQLTLQRLTRDELAEWLDVSFHQQSIARELLPVLDQYTEGNPFLVIQMLRTLLDEGSIWYSVDHWECRPLSELRLPSAASDLMARRLDRLSSDARRVLATAAVVGRTFDVDIVIRAGKEPEDDVLDAIDEGIAAAVLLPSGDRNGDSFTFAHTLLVDAMRRSTNPRRLRRAHEAVGHALVERAPAMVAEIAAHFDVAGVRDKAFVYATRAGERAASLYAHDEATAFLSMACRNADSPSDLALSRLRLAEVAEAAGRYAEADTLTDLVIAWYDESPPSAEQSLRVRRMRERLRSLLGQPPQQTLASCQALLEQAEANGCIAERVALLAMLARAYSRMGDWPNAERLATEGVRLADGLGSAAVLADALTVLGATVLEARPEKSIHMFGKALELFTQVDDRVGQVKCHINSGIAHSLAGNSATAVHSYTVALELGRSAHAPDLTGLASLNLGVVHLKSGRYPQARERFDEALRLFSIVGNEQHRLATLYNLAHLARERGEPGPALELYQQVVSLAQSVGQADVECGAMGGAGLASLALGRRTAAEEWRAKASALVNARRDRWFRGRELAEALRIRCLVALGDLSGAETSFRESLALGERHDPYGMAWLVAECAPVLSDGGAKGVWTIVSRFVPEAEALGYAPLSARYARFGHNTGQLIGSLSPVAEED
jgi:diguanylate cyclase (GGDEF)-like protein/putative nucleotidyltransferase with HDIG domain